MKNNMNITNSTLNSGKRTFRHGKHDNHVATVRGGYSLVALLGVLTLALLTPHVAIGSVSVDVGTQTVVGNDATPQTISLYVNNSGSPITVGSLDFYVELGSGTGTTPYISSVDLLTGTIFENNNSGQSGDANNQDQLQYWAVTKAAGSVGSGPQIPNGSSLLGSVSFVTTGTASGSFSLSLSPSIGSTDYSTDTATPAPVGLSIVNGTLDVVAVPEPVDMALPIFGGLVALTAGLRRWRHRKARAC